MVDLQIARFEGVRRLAALAVVLSFFLAACDGPITPTPTPTPTPPPPPPVTVTREVYGYVLELRETGERVPVPNLRLKVRDASSSSGAVGSTPLADTVTDARGRFTVNDNSAFVLLLQTDPGSEYRFLCDWTPIVTTGPVPEFFVVHKTWSGNRKPPGWYGMEGGAWGTVSELIDGSLQPVADATVRLDAGVPDPPATTSPTGFYMICSVVGADQPRTITAFKTGYNADTREFRSYGDGIHLLLTRK